MEVQNLLRTLQSLFLFYAANSENFPQKILNRKSKFSTLKNRNRIISNEVQVTIAHSMRFHLLITRRVHFNQCQVQLPGKTFPNVFKQIFKTSGTHVVHPQSILYSLYYIQSILYRGIVSMKWSTLSRHVVPKSDAF